VSLCIMLSVIMLSVIMHYAECHYADCHGAMTIGLYSQIVVLSSFDNNMSILTLYSKKSYQNLKKYRKKILRSFLNIHFVSHLGQHH
jgi:hypothetical protein